MTESVSTSVSLLDRVSPTLRRISEGVTGTASEIARLGRSVDTVGASTNGITRANAAVGGLGARARAAGEAIISGLGAGTRQAVDAVGNALKRSGNNADDAGKQADRARFSFGQLAAVAAAGAAAAGIVHFGIQAASFKRNMLAGFELMEGSVEKAQQTYDLIDRFSDKTPFETGNVMTLFKSVRAVGFEMRTTQDIIAGISDVAVNLEPERQQQAMESMVRALSKVQGQGKLTGEALEMINDAASGTALNSMSIFEQVGKIKGITPDAARKLMESGGISASEGITAFLKAVQAGVDKGGDLGTATKKFGIESLGGQMSTFQSRLKKLFADVDISPLVRVMTKLNDILDVSSPTGRMLRRFANETLGSMFATAERLLTPENIQSALQTVRNTIASVTSAVADLWSGFGSTFEGITGATNAATGALNAAGGAAAATGVNWKVFGEALGKIANAIIAVVNAAGKLTNVFNYDGPVNRLIFKVVDGIQNKFAREDAAARNERAALDAAAGASVDTEAGNLANKLIPLGGPDVTAGAVAAGQAVATGMADGMLSREPMVSSAARTLASSASGTVASELEIRSPSQRLRRMGAQTGEGMAMGITETQADVRQAMAGIVSPPAPSLAANTNGIGGTGGAGVVVSIGDVIVQGAANAAAGREAGMAAADALREQMQVLFEEWAAMG
jgi:hypothetical protein